MKKVFNASLVAASLAMAFAANAATIKADPSNPLVLSAEGVATGLVENATVVSFDVVVQREHAATSEIVLTFSDTVDLTALDGDFACGGPTAGSFSCGDVTFNVGTGSFTFDDVSVDADENTITFVVNLGNALTANSAFRVSLGNVAASGNFVELSGAASVSYASNLAGTAIETGSGTLATVAQQFSAVVVTELDGAIERVDRDTFVPGAVTTDGATVRVFDKGADLLAAATLDDVTFTLFGDFDRQTTPPAYDHTGKWLLDDDATAAVGTTAAGTVISAGKAIEFALNTATQTLPDADGTLYALDFDGAGIVIDPTSFGLTVTVDYTGVTSDDADLTSEADAGEWRLDAAVINVPYLPTGYANLSPVVEVSNLGNTDAEIIIEAVGKTGVKYGPVTLSKVAAKNAVTSLFENDLLTAFGLTKGTSNEKLSVTFIIDADADKVTLAPYYRDTTNNNRINVVSDQYKADDIR